MLNRKRNLDFKNLYLARLEAKARIAFRNKKCGGPETAARIVVQAGPS
jgi:hypothetical protein